MKRVLLLDDDPMRIETFRDRYGGNCLLTVTETAAECIVLLRDERFDLVLLDHDLGGEIYCDSGREDCGMEVVRWLAGNRREHGEFILHSYNPAGVELMYAGLFTRGYTAFAAPFGSPAFSAAVERALAIGRGQEKKRIGLVMRVREYFRSLRLR